MSKRRGKLPKKTPLFNESGESPLEYVKRLIGCSERVEQAGVAEGVVYGKVTSGGKQCRVILLTLE